MDDKNLYEYLCPKCYAKHHRLSKHEVKRIVLTDYEDCCDKCGKLCNLVDYVDED